MASLYIRGAFGINALILAFVASMGCSGELDPHAQESNLHGASNDPNVKVEAKDQPAEDSQTPPDSVDRCRGAFRDKVQCGTSSEEAANEEEKSDPASSGRCSKPKPRDYCGREPPIVGSKCREPAKCGYDNGCGGLAVYWCEGGRWQLDKGICEPPPPPPPVEPCPDLVPVAGDACKEPAKCGYADGCGGEIVAWCDGGRWNVDQGTCAPPSPQCGKEPPIVGSTCAGMGKCSYDNGCGGADTYYCDGKEWTVSKGLCSSEECRTNPPQMGDKCDGTYKCQTLTSCGAIGEFWCDGGFWRFFSPDCPLEPLK